MERAKYLLSTQYNKAERALNSTHEKEAGDWLLFTGEQR